jgi:hypothetical protein
MLSTALRPLATPGQGIALGAGTGVVIEAADAVLVCSWTPTQADGLLARWLHRQRVSRYFAT